MSEISVISLPERVDSANAGEVEGLMAAGLMAGGRVVVDGSAIGYMSAAGVRALASTLHLAAERGCRVVFCGFRGAAADCLLVSGFTQLLELAETAEEARQRLLAPARATGERLHARRATG